MADIDEKALRIDNYTNHVDSIVRVTHLLTGIYTDTKFGKNHPVKSQYVAIKDAKKRLAVKIRRQRILDVVSDAVTNLFCCDRKDDEDLPEGEIEEAIAHGEITVDEMVECFRKEIEDG